MHTRIFVLIVLLIAASAFAQGQKAYDIPLPQKITPLNKAELNRLQQQENAILALALRRYGKVGFDHSQSDLRLLQRIIDDKVIPASNTYQLQCLGVVL